MEIVFKKTENRITLSLLSQRVSVAVCAFYCQPQKPAKTIPSAKRALKASVITFHTFDSRSSLFRELGQST